MIVATILRGVGRFVAQPLFLFTAPMLVLATLIWLLGPSIAFGEVRPLADPVVRLAVLLALVLVWAVIALFLGRRRVENDRKLLESLRRQEAEGVAADVRDRSAAAERIEIIRRKLIETLTRLGRERGSRWRRPRAYRLPWYLVIGPPSAGKSNLLLNAGLNMPFGPPRPAAANAEDCDVVFTDQAVFLDTAGRLVVGTGNDGAPVDRLVWLRLLELVRRYRRLQPLCGTILVIDVAELSSLSEEARRSQAKELRRRLDEIGERLESRPPVYVAFAKIDRVMGFPAFFEGLDAAGREQIWGVPFQSVETDREFVPKEHFNAAFDTLVKRAAAHQLQRLQDESDPHQRTLIYEFPDQLASLKTILATVVDILALPHRFDTPPFLRGVFLTSACQEGPPLDLIGFGAASQFGQRHGLARMASKSGSFSRSFFVTALLRDLAIPEAFRSGLSKGARRFTSTWQASIAAVILCASLALAMHWIGHYRWSSAFAAAAEESASSVSQAIGNARLGPRIPLFLDVLPVLDSFHSMEVRTQNEIVPGVEQIATEAQQAYALGLQRLFLPYLTAGLVATLSDEETSAAELFEDLKLYLALGGVRPLETLDLPRQATLIESSWLGAYTDQQRQSFRTHFLALKAHPLPGQSIDDAMVEATRRRISDYTLAQLALDLARRRPEVVELPAWRPSDHSGASGPRVITRLNGESLWDGLPGFYTRAPFRDVVLPALNATAAEIEGDAGWVLGTASGAEKRDVFAGATNLFSADYIRMYDTVLSDLTSIPLVDPAQAARTLSVLIASPSPAAQLLAAIADETDLTPPPPADLDPNALIAKAAARPLPLPGGDPGAAVTEAFVSLRRATKAAEGAPSQVAGTLATFEALYRQLNHIAAGGNILELGTEPQTAADQTAAAIEQLPTSAQPFFRRFAKSATDLINGMSGVRLREVWSTTVGPACLQATQNRFPFMPQAASDTPIDDFKAIFAPDGQIARFRETYLKPSIDTSSRPWTWRPGRVTDLAINEAALKEFEQADAITQAFFPGGTEPTTRFTAEILGLSPEVRVARFDVGGTILRYAHGPVVPLATQWPPSQPGAPAALSLTPEVDGVANMLVGEGDWALFRLVDQAASRKLASDNAILATFTMSGRRATIKLTSSSAQNPFELTLLDRFRCPKL